MHSVAYDSEARVLQMSRTTSPASWEKKVLAVSSPFSRSSPSHTHSLRRRRVVKGGDRQACARRVPTGCGWGHHPWGTAFKIVLQTTHRHEAPLLTRCGPVSWP